MWQALAIAIWLSAVQLPTDRAVDDQSATGCLVLDPSGNYTVVSRVTEASGRQETIVWKLKSDSRDVANLLPHVMQKVEITGRIVSDDSAPVGTAGTVGATGGVDRSGLQIRPRSLKMLSTSCIVE
jgi:hypothetical protein